jgi:hypothetical protein
MTCDGDPDDKWIGITLSFLAVSHVVVVAMTVGGLVELPFGCWIGTILSFAWDELADLTWGNRLR